MFCTVSLPPCLSLTSIVLFVLRSPGTYGTTLLAPPRPGHAEGGAVYSECAISVAESTSSLGTHDGKNYNRDDYLPLLAPATRAHGSGGGGEGGGDSGGHGRRAGRQGKSPASHTSFGPPLDCNASLCSASSRESSAAAAASSMSTVTEPLPPCPSNSAGRRGVAANRGTASSSAAEPPLLGMFAVGRAADKVNNGSAVVGSASVLSSDDGVRTTAVGLPPVAPERRGFEIPTVLSLNNGGGGGANGSGSSETRLSWSVRGQEVGGDAPARTESLANSSSSCSTADRCAGDYSVATVDSVPNSVTVSSFSSAGATVRSAGRLVTTGVSTHDARSGDGRGVTAELSGQAGQGALRKRRRKRRGGAGSAHKIDLGSKKKQEVRGRGRGGYRLWVDTFLFFFS